MTDTMFAALARQTARDLAGAEALYREVLSVRPEEPDCLHMLGVICLETGRTREAFAAIFAALSLTEWQFAAMRHNLKLVLESLRTGTSRHAARVRKRYLEFCWERDARREDVDPLVSIVVPSHDHARWIREALESVYAQTYRRLELVVVDDGSADGSPEIIRRMLAACPFPCRFVARANRGAHATINDAVALASGEYVNVLNSDDRFPADRIAVMVEHVARRQADWGFGEVAFVGENGQAIGARDDRHVLGLTVNLARMNDRETLGAALLHFNGSISSGNLFVRKAFFEALGGMRDYRYNHDWDFCLRAVLESEPVFVPRKLYDYRKHGSNTISEPGVEEQCALERARFLRDYLAIATAPGVPANRFAPTAGTWGMRFVEWILESGQGPFLPRQAWRQLADRVAPSSAAGTGDAQDKESVRRNAHAALLRHLASGESLRIPQAPEGTLPRVSVIVVLYNQAGLTLDCLKALSLCRESALQTIVVDNASTDETPELMARVSGVRYVRNAGNLHFLEAVNQAAAIATGEFLLLLNNDAVLDANALTRAVRRLESSARIGAVGGKVLLYDGSLQEAGCIVWSDGSCLGYGRGMDPEDGPYQFVRNVDYVSGAFLLTRRSLFEEFGRFDSRFAPAYYEETDYCVRLQEAGFDVVYDPSVQIRHVEFGSSAIGQDALELQTRNKSRFVDKHRSFLARQAPPRLADALGARQRRPAGSRRILILDDRVPHLHLGSGNPRANLIVRLLAEQGHEVTFYPMSTPHDDWHAVYRSLPDTVEVMLDRGVACLADFLASRRDHYDVLLVSRPHNLETLRNVLAANPQLFASGQWQMPPLIYDAEAVVSLRQRIEAELAGRPLAESVAAAALASELSLAEDARLVLAVSDAEAEHFRGSGKAEVVVLGHGLAQRPTATAFADRSGFLFVGAMHSDESPNADSMRWFVRQVWPLIRAQLGEGVELDIVGPCHADSIRALGGGDVHVHGAVASLDDFFERARVFVVPTRFAAGIALKAQEAASRGVPMVVTPVIAEQLRWDDAVLSAGGAAEFAGHCVTLYRDESAWTRLRTLALQRAELDCSVDRFRATLHAAVGAACSRPQSAGAVDGA